MDNKLLFESIKMMSKPDTRDKLIEMMAAATVNPKNKVASPEEINDMLTEFIDLGLTIKGMIQAVAAMTSAASDEAPLVKMEYNPKTNKAIIHASRKDFDDKYLKYVLEYANIPQDADITFTEDKPKEKVVNLFETKH